MAQLVGCAHEEELRPAREPVNESMFSLVPPPSAQEPLPPARPRLSQTITLGQVDYSPAAPAPPATAPPSGVNVTVNNNIVNPPVVYGGYGYGAGYGYGYGGSGAHRGSGFDRSGGPSQAWRGSGWEGAQRTAAPGQTPAVGGNWAPPPSYGPAQMK